MNKNEFQPEEHTGDALTVRLSLTVSKCHKGKDLLTLWDFPIHPTFLPGVLRGHLHCNTLALAGGARASVKVFPLRKESLI